MYKMMERNRKGYKAYLRNLAYELPESSVRRRKKLTQQAAAPTVPVHNRTASTPLYVLEHARVAVSVSNEVEFRGDLKVCSEETFEDEFNLLENDGNTVPNFPLVDDDALPIENDVDAVPKVPNGERAIYEGSTVNRSNALTLAIAFAVRHQLTNAARQDLLTLLNTLLPDCVPRSNYFLDKLFFKSDHISEIHVYCPDCQNYLGLSISNSNYICDHCKSSVIHEQCVAQGNYMLVVPMREQLKEMLQVTDLFSVLDRTVNSKGSISTVRDGSMYRNHINSFFMSCPNNFSISWSCDGVPVFKSAHYSIWPLFASINELPLSQRKRFIILTALWFGPTKPRMDTFLKCFVDEMQALFNEGFLWSKDGISTLSKVITLTCVCDAPARALVQNFVQYNGYFGCGFCKHPGERVKKGNGHTTIYPLRSQIPERRDYLETVKHAQEANNTGKPVCGVKGCTMAMLIPEFDIVSGFVPDYMHSVLLGVVRSFVGLWFDSSHHDKLYHIRDASTFDHRLFSIKPPNEIHRKPRSIGDRKLWKASEWRSFLLLYSTFVLQGLLPVAYYKHWMLLVHAVHLLLQSDISLTDISKSKLSIAKFVMLTEELYGLEHVSYNVHILQHLPASVQEWGPLTYHSAFLFEDAAGMLLKMFGGTQCIPQQMIKYYLALRKLQTVAISWLQGADEPTCIFFEELTRVDLRYRIQKSIRVNSCTVLGAPNTRNLSLREHITLQDSFRLHIPQGPYSFYRRMVINNRLYTTADYAIQFKQNNSVCCLATNDFCQITDIVIIKCCNCKSAQCFCSEEVVCFMRMFRSNVPQPVCFDDFVDANLNRFVIKCSLGMDMYVVRASDIIGKCFAYEDNGFCFLTVLPTFELD